MRTAATTGSFTRETAWTWDDLGEANPGPLDHADRMDATLVWSSDPSQRHGRGSLAGYDERIKDGGERLAKQSRAERFGRQSGGHASVLKRAGLECAFHQRGALRGCCLLLDSAPTRRSSCTVSRASPNVESNTGRDLPGYGFNGLLPRRLQTGRPLGKIPAPHTTPSSIHGMYLYSIVCLGTEYIPT